MEVLWFILGLGKFPCLKLELVSDDWTSGPFLYCQAKTLRHFTHYTYSTITLSSKIRKNILIKMKKVCKELRHFTFSTFLNKNKNLFIAMALQWGPGQITRCCLNSHWLVLKSQLEHFNIEWRWPLFVHVYDLCSEIIFTITTKQFHPRLHHSIIVKLIIYIWMNCINWKLMWVC